MNPEPPPAAPPRIKSGSRSYEPYLLLALCSLFFASNIIVGRLVVGHVPPLTMSWLRWTASFLMLLPFAWRQLAADRRILREHWRLIVLGAATGYVVSSVSYVALLYTEALNALLINSSGPLFVALSMLVAFGVRLTLAQTLGILISLIGVIVIILRGDIGALARVHFNVGDILIVMVVAAFGLYSALMTRRPPGLHPLSLLTALVGAAALMLTPIGLAELASGHRLVFDAVTVVSLLYVAAFPATLSFMFFNRAVQMIGPNRAAPFLHLVPVFGSVMAIAFLGERLQLFHVAGYVLVLAGITIAARGPVRID